MNRNQDTLLQLFEQSGRKLHGMLYRLTLDTHVAEDLMQDLFARLCKLENPAQIKNLEAYAWRIAINLAFDWRRQKRSLKTIPDSLVDPKVPHVDALLLQNEQLQQILNAAQQLTGLSRECFVLRYIEQMDTEQIALRKERNTQQVRAICSKGIGRVRQILNDQHASFYKEAINE